MLRQWIRHEVVTGDPFESFLKMQQCIALILDKNVSTMELDMLVDKVASSSTDKACLFYLNVCHWIYKDGRQNFGDGSHPVYDLLNCFTRQPAKIQTWISKQLASTDEEYIVPFLVWMIDILKLSNLTVEGVHLVSILSMESWISRIIDFWYHSHITVVRRSMELMHRWMIKQREQYNNIELDLRLLEYIQTCKRTISQTQLNILQYHDRTEFFHQSIWDPTSPCQLTLDRECLTLLVQITVASISNLLLYESSNENQSLTFRLNAAIQQSMTMFEANLSSSRSLLDFIWNVCGSNDKVMIRLQIDLLDVYLRLEQHNGNGASTLAETLAPLLSRVNPHTLFIYFLDRTGMDYELVVDLLMSDETDMLLFLTQYLKYIEIHTEAFVQAANQVLAGIDGDSEDEEINGGVHSVHSIIALLYQVWTVLQSDIFPYNASVLARRISSVLECLKLAL